ncbi:hypothetical protein [Brevibacillus laterosporus]|uniref:hypothetical protein n=1 Tax=Brevibacillus laterosporus TaxID=1465 RepID=UPI000E6CB018|nr:hypothetical protein [Brevibacillus laterosporus]AYB38482.1 hypothetical protein D5F52_09560 [Brevibacillus laterosporus]NKQ18469.1 WYL domain-containing protein [Brevibacillus laterosporus]WNX33237.1 hypothetical protein RWW94_10760 [Brevibacillus laterosporus]
MPTKYIGHKMEIIYLSREGKLSQRRICVKGIANGLVRGTSESTGEWRTFRIDNILSWLPVGE